MCKVLTEIEVRKTFKDFQLACKQDCGKLMFDGEEYQTFKDGG